MCTRPRIAFATWRSSATAEAVRPRFTKRSCFSPVPSAVWAISWTAPAVSDCEPDEKARQMSLSAALASFVWQERRVNLIDAPGDPSFVADALGALRVCESAIFVVNAVMGVEIQTTRLWQRAAELDIARMLFVNMLDRERADFFRTLDSLKAAFGPHVVATEVPIGVEHDVNGVIDLIDMKAYHYEGGNCSRQLHRDPDPRGSDGPGAGVPRAPDG